MARTQRFRVSIACKAVIGWLLAAPAQAAECPFEPIAAPASARMADLVVDAIGVNTHINYTRSIYYSAFDSIIKPRLLELGVRHIRDAPGGDSDRVVKGRYADLARNGISLLLVTSNEADNDLDYVQALNGGGTQVVDAVEPPNERDNGPWGADWASRMKTLMTGMYPRYKGDAIGRQVKVLGPALANTRDSPAKLLAVFPNAADYMDVGNGHPYSGREPEGRYGGGWSITLSEALNRQRLGSGKPVWASENGYKMSGSSSGHPAVTQRAAAKYLPRQILSHIARNAPRLYAYQLINDHAGENFGLLNDDGSRRQQFNALKNLIGLFGDKGQAFTPASLTYAVEGTLADIQQMLFQKRDGRYYLTLWQGVPSSSIAASDGAIADIEPARRPLTLRLGSQIAAVKVYEPSFSAAPVQSLADPQGIGRVLLQVADHLTVIELTPAECAALAALDDAAVTQAAQPVTIAVLANDTGTSLAVSAVSDPPKGTAAISAAKTAITYTPDTGFTGTDSFSYTASDDRGGTDTATVSVTVTAVEPPAPVYLGCYKDQGTIGSLVGRDLDGSLLSDSRGMTTESCAATCRARGFAFAGTQAGKQCFCGNDYGSFGTSSSCSMPCTGNSGQTCGGSWANSVYRVP